MIDRDIHLARALLVESNHMLRSVAAGQLRDMGIGQVSQASRATEARVLLERERFDIVVCTRELDDSPYSGQDLLDELRRENLLPHSTVFLMVVSKATYHQVMEGAEAALDGLLLRPYTAAQLAERLQQARKRKRELDDVLRALDAGETQVALVRAVKRFQEGQAYARWCGRLAAELFLTLARPADAQRLFEALVPLTAAADWARLGVARALLAAGNTGRARKLLAELLASNPEAADAHDLVGRLLVEQSDFDGALIEYRRAAELTPGCLLRAQHAGALAFYQGHGDEALVWLERALQLGAQSKLFDALTLLLIALLRHDRGDGAGTDVMHRQLQRYLERFPQSRRLQRLQALAAALVALQAGRDDDALAGLRRLADEAGADDFDLESANMLLALWARVPAALQREGECAALTERVALRFCSSKAVAEALLASARRSDAATALIRRCQGHIATLCEAAMDQALKGQPGPAVQSLLQHAEQTLNAKLLETAALLARRFAAGLPEADALVAQATATLQRCCKSANHIAGIQRSGRSPGALQLRGASSSPAPDALNPAVSSDATA